jgi:hypothetical protein
MLNSDSSLCFSARMSTDWVSNEPFLSRGLAAGLGDLAQSKRCGPEKSEELCCGVAVLLSCCLEPAAFSGLM